MIGRKLANIIRLAVSYIILIVLAISALYPAIWIVLGSLRPGKSLYSKRFIPDQLTLVHYKELFTSQVYLFGTWYMNTLKIALCSMVIGVLLILLTSYAVSDFVLRDVRQRCPRC